MLAFRSAQKDSLNAPQQEKYLTFLTLADGSLPTDELAQWLRERIAPISF